MKWKPKPYQLRAVKFMLDRGAAGLFLDPGLGKTSISLAVTKILREQKVARRVLVIAPLRPVYHVWPREVEKWDDFNKLKVGILHGPKKDQVLAHADADIYLINPEGLEWLDSKNVIHKKFFDVLIIDESSRFKRTNTQRFRLLKPLLQYFRKRFILTGSPTPHGMLDLFGQIYVLDMGKTLGRFISEYRHKWFVPYGYGGYSWAPKPGAEDEITKRIAPLVLRMSEKEYLKMPKLLPPKNIFIELPKDARRKYDEMEVMLITQIANDEITAANAAVASMKCRQIANGGLYIDEFDEHTGKKKTGKQRRYAILHNEKTDALNDLLEELEGQPALVSFDFEHDLARLLAKFKNTPVLGSGVSQNREAEIIDQWNLGRLPKVFGNPASIAHGLNLQGGRAVVWHSLTFNYEHYDQFNRRVYRQGQKYPVGIYRIIAKDTTDEVMLKVLEQRETRQEAFFQGLKAYASRRRRSLGL